MICFDHVSFKYPSGSSLVDISFTVQSGEFVALLGENGAGKSTLCRLCNGLLKPSAGNVWIDNKNTKETKTSTLAQHIGYLFQNPDRQICHNTVAEELLFGLNFVGFSPREAQERCKEMLELFSLNGSRDPFNMSRGERQQVALASVLARKPQVLILDEPTTGLDYRECVHIMDILLPLHRAGTTIFMISHDMELVNDYAERVLLLSCGALIGDGPTHALMKNKALLDQASLLPAQIPALALRLGSDFDHVCSVDGMIDTIGKKKGLV
ncbi:MAG: energy-coupling factor ABC transporter ATP-binding protein [Treponema sp.]|jgi:energy-coupling factor transport system ATP-binding protein|nr:energy-coupling factor ABC transporter ATP-binding protein [Treponema sp.]